MFRLLTIFFGEKKETSPSLLSFAIHNTTVENKPFKPLSSEDKKKQKFYQSIKI